MKTHVKHPTKMSVPQCENEKEVTTGRCCFPKFKIVKMSHWYYHWSFYYDAAKLLLQKDNCIIITSNWMAW